MEPSCGTLITISSTAQSTRLQVAPGRQTSFASPPSTQTCQSGRDTQNNMMLVKVQLERCSQHHRGKSNTSRNSPGRQNSWWSGIPLTESFLLTRAKYQGGMQNQGFTGSCRKR